MTPRPAALPDWTPTVAGFYRSIKVPMHDGSYEWTKAQAQAFFASDRCHKMEALGGRCFVMPAVGDDDRVCIFCYATAQQRAEVFSAPRPNAAAPPLNRFGWLAAGHAMTVPHAPGVPKN